MLPGDDALVAGFIVTPGQPKELLLRGLGPSLPMAGALADPTIELFEENGIAFAFNDNWRDEQTVPDCPADTAADESLGIGAVGDS